MAKKTIPVARTVLQAAINEVESKQSFSNLSSLHVVVSDRYNASSRDASFPDISPSVVGLRIKEFNLTHKTTAGKRGRGVMTDEQKAAMAAGRAGGRRSRSEKFAENPAIANALIRLRVYVPERFHNKVDKVVQGGSMKAAVALKCLDCAGFSTVEIRNCAITQCALWAFRPYQGNASEGDEGDEGDEAEEAEEAEIEEVAA